MNLPIQSGERGGKFVVKNGEKIYISKDQNGRYKQIKQDAQ